jgi:2-hydroxychromene-2-carboxylate isomerase
MRNIILLSVLVVILAAFFASANPDGLEKVAETLGFTDRAVERTSVMSGYTVPFIANQGISTAIAGIFGVFICLGLFWGTARVLQNKRTD